MNAEHQAAFGPQSRRLSEETRAALYQPRRTPQIDGGVLDSTRALWEVEAKLREEIREAGGFTDALELLNRFTDRGWSREELTAARESLGAEFVQDRTSGRWFVVLR